ncbi:MAG TPA: DUF4249 domain-containing protein [Panacibacter sp.]|nr:DUF4249 domain-containing protein [Panacibacter sp.]HNP43858.1 DUF4249 domain-containing protein [Panacibacter sp.]
MNRYSLRYCVAVLVSMMSLQCVKPYNPPVFQRGNNYLVVDGFINTGADQATRITLGRARNLNDSTVISQPELNATVTIKSDNGNTYPLASNGDGVYTSAPLSLDNSISYQLVIETSNGEQYNSEFVASIQTPAIDSLTWEQPDNLGIYLYTHDPANKTHYYKWTYAETWQYNSQLSTLYDVANNLVFICDTTNQIDSCWKNDVSTDVLIGSSVALSQDVIDHQKIKMIPQNDERLGIRYSMLVTQTGISSEAYQYWQIVQENSQNRGGLFDLQPGQLGGNIHSLSNPNEPVIGFVSAATSQQLRIFINNSELNNWKIAESDCALMFIPQNPVDFRIFDYEDPEYAPWYFVTGGGIAIVHKECLDCRLHGGVNKRPGYW